jgi:raffinose/stachyose/melibiose transport system substrate-binding protein
MRKFRKATTLVVSGCALMTLVATGTTSASAAAHKPAATVSGKKVTLVWWNNATTGTLLTVFNNAIKAFDAANPNVTIQNVPIQNEVLQDTKIPLALQGNNVPDIFQQWGGGREATEVTSGKLMDMTAASASWIKQEAGAVASGWAVNGKQYGIPYDLHVVGFWYRKDLFAKAGITSTPTTITQLEADVTKLRAANIQPISVGSKDKWPDAFWWEYFALRECSLSTLKTAISTINLNQPCFVKAGTDLTTFIKTNPFNTGYLATPAQTGAGSSAGLVANGQAAMELQGDWDPGVMQPLTTNKNILNDLGFFPFPAVTGGAGNPSEVLGGGDGFSCSTKSTSYCPEFLKYIDSTSVQIGIAGANVGLPVNTGAVSAVKVPAEKAAISFYKNAAYLQTYFDVAFPVNVGNAIDAAIADYFAGQGTPQSIIQAVAKAKSQ